MSKIFIVEDDENQLITLRMKVESLGYKIVGTSQRAIEALTKIKETIPDVVLLDINLNGDHDGILLGSEIKTISPAKIIFITALSTDEIVEQVVNTNPEAYLLKPIKTSELKVAIELALAKKKGEVNENEEAQEKADILTVRLGNYLYNINIEEIVSFHAGDKNYTSLTTIDHKKYQVRTSLRQLQENELPKNFIQVHRKHIINLHHINHINERELSIQLKNETYVAIGKTYKKALFQQLNLH